MGSRATSRGTGWFGLALRIALVGGAYVVGAKLGLRLAFENRNVTAVWPPTGIAVAALLLWGNRVLPGVAIGALAANVLNGAGIEASLGIAVGNTLAPLVGTWVMRRLRIDITLAHVRDVLLLVFVGGFLAMTISASAGTTVLWLTDQIGDNQISSVWLVWWIGDAIGVVLFAPFLLLFGRTLRARLVRAHPFEAVGLFVLTGLCAVAVFSAPVLIPYVAFVPIVWAALRFEHVGAVWTTIAISVIAVVATVAGRGPFAPLEPTTALVSLQTFNASIALTALLLAAVRRERRVAVEALRSSEELYRKLFEQANDFVCIHNSDGRITFANAAAERITGYPRDRLQGMTIGELVAPEYIGIVRRMTHRQLARTDEPQTYEIDVVGTNGRRVSLEISSALVHESDDTPAVQLIGRDVTTRRLAEEQLRHRVLHDDLTDLPNETLLRERLDYAVTLAHQHQTSVALLLVDLDRFGELNRARGRAWGDGVLQEVARTIGGQLKEGDSVARLRADEYGVLLTRIDGVDDATTVAQQLIDEIGALLARPADREDVNGDGASSDILDIRDVIERTWDDGTDERPPAASIGIVVYPGRTRDADTLLQQADMAMHAARAAGGAGYQVFGPQHDPGTVRRLVLEDDLPEAIESDGLDLLYQPKITVGTLQTAGVECVVSWVHPRHGTISADELVRTTEHGTVNGALTSWTLKEALRRRRLWTDAEMDLSIAVNVSARDLVRPAFADDLRVLIDQTRVAPSSLVIEISERDIMDTAVQAIVARLADMGVTIAIDNFGTGYSSLVQLRRLPIAEIKVDRAFVTGLATNIEDREIAHSIVELGHNIGVRVVADGIETRETWHHLVELGYDLAQGPLICEPVPADELESWLRTPAWTDRVG